MNSDPKYYNTAVLKFYNSISEANANSVLDIPAHVLEKLLLYERQELYRPLIFDMLSSGHSWRSIMIKLGVTMNTIRQVSKKLKK